MPFAFEAGGAQNASAQIRAAATIVGVRVIFIIMLFGLSCLERAVAETVVNSRHPCFFAGTPFHRLKLKISRHLELLAWSAPARA